MASFTGCAEVESMRRTILVLGSVLAGLIVSGATVSTPVPPAAAGIHILSDTVLPQTFEWASDVRWASDQSVYLALAKDGAVEVSLDPKGPPPKELISGTSKPGGFWSSRRLAVSSRFLVVAAPAHSLTWRRLDDPARTEESFEGIQAIDARENQLAILGLRRDDSNVLGKDGAIAWMGSLDKKLADLRPLLYDIAGPGAATMTRCPAMPLGAVRFLPDASLLVLPGVQPGVSLYDDHGKLIRTWDTGALGIDTDCPSLTDEQAQRLSAHAPERHAWLNQRRTVDSVLPLPQGPALIIRRAEKGHTHWDLKVLRRDGPSQSYPIPIEGGSEFFNLHGDVRDGKIVFLLYETVFRGGAREHPTQPRLIVAQLI